MGTTPEATLTKKIRRAIDREFPGAWHCKLAGGPYQDGGLPDLLVILNGTAVGMEIKAQRVGESIEHARGRASQRQLAKLQEMRDAGAFGEVICGPEEALNLLRNIPIST